ncbi:MAG: hypothetical protein J7L79_01865, partial [Thaumarchaeota archaeon]|nr:hypothetical protein [Nitrososphaerota archaeon]
LSVPMRMKTTKLRYSTLNRVETMELKYIRTRKPPPPQKELPTEPEYGNKIGGSLSSLLKKVKDKVSFQP